MEPHETCKSLNAGARALEVFFFSFQKIIGIAMVYYNSLQSQNLHQYFLYTPKPQVQCLTV